MTKDEAVDTIWNYMHMQHELRPADLIFILGSNDVRVAEHAVALYKAGFAPIVAISGDGTKHETALLRDAHGGKTEASILKDICLRGAVPESALIIEERANNTGQNFEYITPLLEAAHLTPKTAIIVQKPYMERRAYATGKVWWPNTDLILTSTSGSFSEYTSGVFDPDIIINIMLGDLERIKEYPAKGFQIPQDIPHLVWDSFLYLKNLGYTKHLLQ